MGDVKRSPAVAGQFYPGQAKSLARMVAELCGAGDGGEKVKALTVVSPHAGYVYSGGVAGQTFARIEVPETVVILGPNHHGHGAEVALMAGGCWQMPMGEVLINEELAAELTRGSAVVQVDELAHRYEHSLEVQVPFLQHFQKKLTIVPLCISHLSFATCAELGRDLARAIKGFPKPVLMVASTDMTHYESRQAAGRKDRLAIEQITALNAEGLYRTVLGQRISMCGIMPTTVAMIAALELGASRAELVHYTDSGEASGDTYRVVGYAGMIIS